MVNKELGTEIPVNRSCRVRQKAKQASATVETCFPMICSGWPNGRGCTSKTRQVVGLMYQEKSVNRVVAALWPSLRHEFFKAWSLRAAHDFGSMVYSAETSL